MASGGLHLQCIRNCHVFWFGFNHCRLKGSREDELLHNGPRCVCRRLLHHYLTLISTFWLSLIFFQYKISTNANIYVNLIITRQYYSYAGLDIDLITLPYKRKTKHSVVACRHCASFHIIMRKLSFFCFPLMQQCN